MDSLPTSVKTPLELSGPSVEMVSTGKAKIADIFDNWIIYRQLEPIDRRLKGLKNASGKMEISNEGIPRKNEEDYARASMWFLKQMQTIQQKTEAIQELLFIGDSLYSDGHAYENLRQLTGWTSSCFIGDEVMAEAAAATIADDSGIYLSNRWAGVAAWVAWALHRGMKLDQSTAVIVDIDKTLLGAKGRNDQVIDRARLEGIYRTMDSVLGDSFDRAAFERQYAELNQSSYHIITADNQDYLAYICLVLNAKLLQLDELVGEIQNNRLSNFEQFARWVNTRLMIAPTGTERLRQVHEAVMMSIHAGDPTPFKQFRVQEFLTTAERMGSISDDSPVEDLLRDEITITKEIADLSLWLSERGCTLLCMSDKPDQSAIPDRHMAAEFLPIHQISTHCVGCNIQDLLSVL